MLYIDYTLPNRQLPYTTTWHIGELIDGNVFLTESTIVLVQADGDELEYIKRNFTNIPFHVTKRVQRWVGDDAGFIAHNLTTR